MSSKLIPPPPPTVPIGAVRNGSVVINQQWAHYLTVGLPQRLGGYNALTIDEIEAALNALDARVDVLEDFVDAFGAWEQVEIDFGTKPVYSATFTITDTKIGSDSLVRVMPVAKAATGRTADDWAWDGAVFAAQPGVGQATVYATFLPGPIVGPRVLQYSVG